MIESEGGESELLAVAGLVSHYGPVAALREVSLTVQEGEIVALVGPIGAGKSTLLSSLVGLHPSTSGSVTFAGLRVEGQKPEEMTRLGMALVPERRRIFSDLTVRENLWLGTAARPVHAASGEEWDQVFGLFPVLKDRLDGKAGYLSGGEAQQLAIGRALMSRPKLLLLDEPSLGLAPKVAESVFRLLSELSATGLTVLLVEQNAFQALALADRGYVLENGEIQIQGSGAELLARRDLMEAYLGVRRQNGAAGG